MHPQQPSKGKDVEVGIDVILRLYRGVTGGFLQDKWAISYTRGSTISFIRGSYWWYREVLLRSWAVLGDFKRFLDNVVLVASLSFAFYACFMRFSISRCRPLYKASLENVEVAC
jgi:hypothetical protein